MPTEPRRPRSANFLFAAALLLFVAGSLVAWWQPLRLSPLKPQTTTEWWLQALGTMLFGWIAIFICRSARFILRGLLLVILSKINLALPPSSRDNIAASDLIPL